MKEDSPFPNPPDPLRVLLVEDSDSDYLLLLRRVRNTLPVSTHRRAVCRAELMTELTCCWDLIITDLHLLDIEKNELLDAISTAQPVTPCLVMTGSLRDQGQIVVSDSVLGIIEKGDNAGLQAALATALKYDSPAF